MKVNWHELTPQEKKAGRSFLAQSAKSRSIMAFTQQIRKENMDMNGRMEN